MNAKIKNCYNLLEEQWIPVLWHDGTVGRIGIIDALTQAHRIRQIAASNPMDRVAILRFLLALLYWCKGNPLDNVEASSISSFPADWFSKLNANRDCFNLLGEGKRFYQDREADGKAVAVTNLLHDLPSGSKIAHFRHARDFHEGLCLACCAMGLLRWSCIASAGTAGPGQSMTASVNGNTPAYSLHAGLTLFETLRLNWPHGHSADGDAPIWGGAAEESPLGFLKGMTWQSRRILLEPKDARGNGISSVGHCYYCGEQTDHLVKTIRFRPGWKRPSKEPWSGDPHLLRVNSKDKKGKAKKIVPSWPSPNDPLEDHATNWRFVLQGLLHGGQSGPAQFETTLIAASQALYKHVETHAIAMPILERSIAQILLNELEWLKQSTWKTTSARTKNWRDRPNGHVVIDALCSSTAKGHAIRSGCCAESFVTENELEKAFGKLIQKLASTDQTDANAHVKILGKWKDEVCRILQQNVKQVVDFTIDWPPLRRLEGRHQANVAVQSAVRQMPKKKG